MSVFKRLYDISRSEFISVDEDFGIPIRDTEEAINHLQIDIDDLVAEYAEVKALHISSKKRAIALREKALEYERKAILFVKKEQEGSLSVIESERLAKQALELMGETLEGARIVEKEARNLSLQVEKMGTLIHKAKNDLGLEYNGLYTMKSRVRLDEANRGFDRVHEKYDTDETIAMLERMKEKVELQEKLSGNYKGLDDDYDALDAEIDKVLLNDKVKTTDALNELKKQMNIIKSND